MTVSIISTEKAPAAVGPYSQAVRVAQMFPAGEGSIVYASGQAFANLAAVAEEAGASLAHAVKLTLFLTDLSQFATVNAIMRELVPEPFPARSTIGVAALPLGAAFEVEGVFAA